MTIEKQCCTLQQAKRLKELGVNVRCVFGYIEIPENGLSVHWYWRDDKYALINANIVMYVGNGDQRWYAPTVAELGEMLPDDTRTYRYDDRWSAYAPIEGILQLFTFAEDKTEAQCRAALLIHLIENNIVSVKEINKRLQSS